MEKNQLVTVIMPSYNCGKFVDNTIYSVQAQTYQNWELLFVDDYSKDDSVQKVMALAAADSRIKVFKNSKNSGAAVSRNKALKEAKGRWIAFLDSDDLWEPTKLERQIEFMEKNKYAFSYTRYSEIDEDGRELGTIIGGPKHISKQGMYAYCWPGCLTVMYDANKIGLVQIADIKKNNDYAIWLKVCRKADCYLLDDCLAKYRHRTGSISNHGYLALIKWHYKLFHDAEGMNMLASSLMTVVNMFFGVMKKLLYMKRQSI